MKRMAVLLLTSFALTFGNAQDCPGISVYPYSDEITAGDTLSITCVTQFLKTNVTYNWTISAGAIIAGQGTARILVNTADAGGMYITATVELGGLPAKCASTASASAEVIPAAQLVVKGTFTNGQELKNAVQKFLASSSFTDPGNLSTGFIYLYGAANTTTLAMESFKNAITGAFDYNKIFPHQYKIAEGGKKKLQTYEIYLLQERSKEPLPSN